MLGSFVGGCIWVKRRRGAMEHLFAQGADHELSEACASDIHDIFEGADGQCRDQVPSAQPTQSFEFLMPRERIYNMALQFEWRWSIPSRWHPGRRLMFRSRPCPTGKWALPLAAPVLPF